jgi:hypothetical protein
VLSRLAHPKVFAHLDHFGGNAEIASAQGLFVKRRDEETTPRMAVIHTMDAEEPDDLYGSVYDPIDQEDFKTMLNSGLWLERHAKELMVNQRRIYCFLGGMVTTIMDEDNEDRLKVDNENQVTPWVVAPPQLPDPEEENDEKYQHGIEDFLEWRNHYLEFCNAILPYTSMVDPMDGLMVTICDLRIDDMADLLQTLKGRPGEFLECLVDIHEHSYYMLKDVDDQTHPWVSNFA